MYGLPSRCGRKALTSTAAVWLLGYPTARCISPMGAAGALPSQLPHREAVDVPDSSAAPGVCTVGPLCASWLVAAAVVPWPAMAASVAAPSTRAYIAATG
eukprot:3013072-Prymnesium_polylepis.2